MIEYFGTSLNEKGHYFWKLDGEDLLKSKTWFRDLPFNPEELIEVDTSKGTVKYFRKGGYVILVIAGSCIDKRWGSKSVFWTDEPIKLEDLKDIVMSIPIGRKIIEQMPFEVLWNDKK